MLNSRERGGHFAVFDIFALCYHLIVTLLLPILEYFWKIQRPLLIITLLLTFKLHEMQISEKKTIKTKLLTQKQSKKLFSAVMWAKKLKEHNTNTHKNETRGILYKIN